MHSELHVPSTTATLTTDSQHSRTTACLHVREVVGFILTCISFLLAHLAVYHVL